MKKIIVPAFICAALCVSFTAKAQTQSDRDFKNTVPVYDIGKIDLQPPVMVPGVTVADKNDVVKPGAARNLSSGNAGNANVNLSTNVPVIPASEGKKNSKM